MDLSIVIVNWNCARYTRECITSILGTTSGLDYEIIVVDNASTDDSVKTLDVSLDRTTLIRSPENVGFARANNLGAREAGGRYLLFLNPDTTVIGGAIPQMLSVLESSSTIGAVGCRLLNADRTLQTSCVQTFPTILNQLLAIDGLRALFPSLYGLAPLFAPSTGRPVDVPMVSGACVMMRRETFERIGGFNRDYFLYGEDLDLCYEVGRASLRVCFVGDAEVVHYGGGSSSKESSGFSHIVMRESIARFLRKTRGARYAHGYRLAMGASAIVRIAALRLALLLRWDGAGLTGPLAKWRRILNWSRGRERWAAELGAAPTASAKK